MLLHCIGVPTSYKTSGIGRENEQRLGEGGWAILLTTLFSWKGQQALLPARENTALGYAVRAAPVPELPGLPGPNHPPIVEWVPDSSPNPIFWRW